ncbi:phosphate propanoyltransferase [Desulfosporosinus youngiae]|uniref:Phosphate propanoyltransferase n=1 Tax=Desulfosporosinus youngiae DSM 17734 TaxID=768710 RepID=H5XTP1_9FIRM|nr:phosphate propanoyltransferase [Desulfosporosinus youngiae]EHQ88774.1 propanediol utilization protein [Desulfosporosinus youngiae DSM 17734]
MIVTEQELRANWHKTKDKLIKLPPGSVITPSARDFIRSKGIDVQIEGNGLVNQFNGYRRFNEKPSPASERQTRNGQGIKPEHMTHLRSGDLVTKVHPVVAYRGQLDLFQCEIVEAQVFFQQKGEVKLIQYLDEIAAFARQIMVSEVKEEPFHWETLIGLNPQELRERSHHPKKYFGIEHTPLSYTNGSIVAKLHHLRAKCREVELYANRAFTDETGGCRRTDLIQALNRLSSAFYILACEVQGRKDQDPAGKTVPIGISNRHVHLSQDDLRALFGEDHELTFQKALSQPDQFAAKETVTLVGPKGRFENVRILGPVRKSTQAELSVTDCFKLGIKPVIRDSGRHEGTPGLKILGPVGNVELEAGVIVAGRHIHLHTDDARDWSLKDGDRVRVKVESQRPTIYEDVLIRVSNQYHKEMHLDLDEANAALIDSKSLGKLMGV